MLRYVSGGTRTYHDRSMLPCRRRWWEFEAVVAGRCAPVFPGREPELATSRLWVFPPECSHGWMCAPGETCEIAVFQFDQAPEPLASLARERGHLEVVLDDARCGRLREFVARGRARMRQPTDRSALEDAHLLSELALLALEPLPARPLTAAQRAAEEVCEQALAWFTAHMAEGVGVAEVAAAAQISVAHLRRLFHQTRGVSPGDALDHERMRRAEDLLRDGVVSQDSVAGACGFGSVSSFSRAFRRRHGMPPAEWMRLKGPQALRDGA